MYQEERIWFNQQLLYFQDSSYGSNGVLDIGLTSSTSDYKSFSTPALNLQVINDLHRKNIVINYQNSRDLIQSIGMAVQDLKTSFENKHQILKKYIKGKNLIFDFIQNGSGTKVINISIKSGDTDFTNIFVDIPTLSTFFNLLKKFENEYLNLSINFQTRSMIGEMKNELEAVKNSIHSLPSHIMNMELPKPKFENIQVPEIEQEVISSVEELNTDFDNFLGENLKNIELADIPEPKKKEGIKTSFLSTTLNGNIKNFESLITAISQDNKPLLDIVDRLRETSSDVDYLPGIEEDDMKAILHLSKVFFNVQLKNYLNGISVSSTPPVIWYKTETHGPENVELAYDLMMISGYLRVLKSKLENKLSDAQENRSLLYLATRCFTDPLVFSFINSVNPDMMKNCVLSRFDSYKESGFFKYFDKILIGYDCSEVSKVDLSKFLDDVVEKVINKHPDISILYPKAGFKLGYKNKLYREHIIKETIPLETELKLGLDLYDDDKIICLPFKISDDVLQTFRGIDVTPKKSRKVKNDQKLTNLLRFVTQFRNEIPSKYRDEFLEHINALKTENYDFPTAFQIEDLGENILKAIYIWNMIENKDIKYTDYFSNVEDCLMDKKMIVTKFNSNGHEDEDTESFETIVQNGEPTEVSGITDWITSLDV